MTAADVAFTYNTGLKAKAGSNIVGARPADLGLAGRRSTTTRKDAAGHPGRRRHDDQVRARPAERPDPADHVRRRSGSRRSIRSTASRSRTTPSRTSRRTCSSAPARTRWSSSTRKQFVNFEAYRRLRQRQRLQGPAGGRQDLDPDLRGREHPADVHAGRRGRLPVLPPPDRATSSSSSRRSRACRPRSRWWASTSSIRST